MHRSGKSPKSCGSVKRSGGGGGGGRRYGGSKKRAMGPEAWELKKRRARAYHVAYTNALSDGKMSDFAELEAQLAYKAVTP